MLIKRVDYIYLWNQDSLQQLEYVLIFRLSAFHDSNKWLFVSIGCRKLCRKFN